MSDLVLGEYLGTVDVQYRVLIPKKQLLDRMDLGSDRKCIFAGKSADCVSLWTLETWRKKVRPRIDAIITGLDTPVGHLHIVHRKTQWQKFWEVIDSVAVATSTKA